MLPEQAASPEQRVFTSPPVVIGHRGYGKGVVEGHRENTLDSVAAAVDAGLDWVEVDVRRTADDALVVLHHPTGDGGEWIADITADEAGTLGMPSLEELLAVLPRRVGVDIDLKTSLEDATRSRERTTAALLAPHLIEVRAHRPVLVTSFDAAALVIIRDRAPGVPVGLLTWTGFPLRKAVPMAAHLGFQVVAAHWKSFAANEIDPAPLHRETAYSVRVAHDAGLEVAAWCPGGRDAVRLVEAGVDALVVNDVPDVLAALAALPTGR